MVVVGSEEWQLKPWKARIYPKVQETLDGVDSSASIRIKEVIDEIVAHPENVPSVGREPAGVTNGSWNRYRVTIPDVGIMTYAPIEHSPPVYFKVVIFDTLLVSIDGPQDSQT